MDCDRNALDPGVTGEGHMYDLGVKTLRELSENLIFLKRRRKKTVEMVLLLNLRAQMILSAGRDMKAKHFFLKTSLVFRFLSPNGGKKKVK